MSLKSPLTPAVFAADKIIRELDCLGRVETLMKGSSPVPPVKAQGASVSNPVPTIAPADIEAALGDDTLLTIRLILAARAQADPAKRTAALAALA